MAGNLVVQTVTGAIPADSLGSTICHEHLFVDIRWFAQAPSTPAEQDLRDRPVTMDLLGWLALNPEANLDNLVIDDEQLII